MKDTLRRGLPATAIYFFIFYAGNSVQQNFLPVYLSEGVGLSSAQLGFLLAIGPAVAMAVQPFWGVRADRARYKNTVLIAVLAATLLTSLLIPLRTEFWYVTAAVTLMYCFQTSNIPLLDAVAVELCGERGWDYGRIRGAASVGFSAMGWISGAIIGGVAVRLFPLYAGLTLVSIGVALILPRVPGRQRVKMRMPYGALLKNRRLLMVLTISFVANLTLGIHYSFFGVYFRELGGSTALLGLAVFCGSMCELPFTMFSRRVIQRLGGPEKSMLAATAFMGMRWLLASRVTSPVLLLLVNCMHGFSFVVLAVTVIVYIGEHAPPELKASGQVLNGILSLGLARILGSLGGGFLVGVWGKPGTFLFAAILNFAAVAVFSVLLQRIKEDSLHRASG